MAFFKFRKSIDGKAALAPSPQESIDQMRRRAKQRLLGATVLVALAVIGFPMLFDSQPRPVSVDIPIDIPDRNKVKPLILAPTAALAVAPPPLPMSATSAALAPKSPEAVPAKDSVAAATNIGSKEEIVTDKPAAKTPDKPAAVTLSGATKADDGSKAKALLEGKDAGAQAAAPSEPRFVVQVGAFADADKAAQVRQVLERAGLKTYAQVVDTKDGKRTRVRVGPFADKAQAEQTAEKVKALDLPVAVLAL